VVSRFIADLVILSYWLFCCLPNWWPWRLST